MLGEMEMKKFLAGLFVGATLVGTALGINSHMEKKEVAQPEATTENFVVQYQTEDNLLSAKPANPAHKQTYLLDNKYEVGDVVKVTYHKDDIISEKKLTGKALDKVEKNYGENINKLIEEGSEKAQELSVVTRSYVINSIDKDGMAHGKMLSNVETGEVKIKAEKNYSLGDIVSVTFNSETGKVFEHHELEDQERFALLDIKEMSIKMDDIMKSGEQTKNLNRAEDGTYVSYQ
jgi:hypothetical protein